MELLNEISVMVGCELEVSLRQLVAMGEGRHVCSQHLVIEGEDWDVCASHLTGMGWDVVSA